MRRAFIAFLLPLLLFSTSCSSVAQELDSVAQRLQEIEAMGYENIDFTVSKPQFLNEFRGATKVPNEDEGIGVTYYAVQGVENNSDVIGFQFLNDELMNLLISYQGDRIDQLGGADALKTDVIERFGRPTEENDIGTVWSFPTIDRKIVAVLHEGMWTLSIQRTSLAEQLKTKKTQLSGTQSELPQSSQTSEAKEPKEGWVFWQPTAAEWAEMAAEARASSQRHQRKPFTGVHVTRKQFGDKWPFTVEEGNVEDIDYAVVFHTNDGKKYALNGIAMGRGYLDIEPIWRPHPVYEGMKVSVGPLIEVGTSTRSSKSSDVQHSNGDSQQHRRSAKSVSRKEMVAKLAEKTLTKSARALLPAARHAARLSAKDNAAAERYLDSEVRPHVRRDPTLTDSSFAVDGLCQVCFDYDDTNLAGQICVTARVDGYEDVSVNIWPK